MKVKFSSLDTPFDENDCQKFLSWGSKYFIPNKSNISFSDST
jgi:hypothetical protein